MLVIDLTSQRERTTCSSTCIIHVLYMYYTCICMYTSSEVTRHTCTSWVAAGFSQFSKNIPKPFYHVPYYPTTLVVRWCAQNGRHRNIAGLNNFKH